MAENTVFEDGDYLSLPVKAGTKSGDPVRVGGLNGVAQTAIGGGGNAAANASVMLKGVHKITVTGAVANVGDPVYIDVATGGVNVTNTNPVFGHALETKAAAASDIRVRVNN
jgi:predicted RecA/RadA family phage recombinase